MRARAILIKTLRVLICAKTMQESSSPKAPLCVRGYGLLKVQALELQRKPSPLLQAPRTNLALTNQSSPLDPDAALDKKDRKPKPYHVVFTTR